MTYKLAIVLRDELETTMKMCGVTRLDEVHAGFLNTRAVDHLIPDVEDEPAITLRKNIKSHL